MASSTNSLTESAEMSAPEDIDMDEDQLRAYQEASSILQTSTPFLVPLFSVVPVQEGIPSEGEESARSPSSDVRHIARSPFRLESPGGSLARTSWFSDLGNFARSQPLQEALKQLEGLEKEEACLVERSDLSRKLTQILTEEIYQDTAEALSRLTTLGQAVPRRVCQHPFRKNDIVWVCRTCQADETCVLCHACFSQSDHEGHDVNFYHAQAGGCCDCGDPDAWDPAGFCPFHGPNAHRSSSDPGALPPTLVNRVRGVVPAIVDWLVHTIAEDAEQAYERVNPQQEPAMQADSDVEIMDVDDIVMSPRSHIFSPTAASTNRALRDELLPAPNNEVAYSIGHLGSTGHGLFLILHADDIHVKTQVVEALRHFWGASMFFSDMVINRMVDALKQYGQLIIWGTSEICAELTSAQAHLWIDGDKVACTRVGEIVLERAHRLSRHGMFCSVLTYDELLLEQQAVAILQWLSIVARSCDPLCLQVAECILPNRHLVPLLSSDFKMSSRVTKAWYSLLLTLLAVPTFKSHLAAAYCDTYRDVTSKYARGMGVLERSGYTLSVQFLNRVTYVIDLVRSRDLLGKLGKSLLETLMVATKSQHYNGRLDPNHFVLAHRRYSPCVSDLKCVLNVAGMPRVASCCKVTFLEDWIATLAVAQFMDPQYWRSWSQGHIEDESRGWVGAFNASISLGSLFERLLGWQDDDESPIKHPGSPLSKDLMSCVELTFHIIAKGIGPWQRKEQESYHATSLSSSIPPHKRCSRSLAFSTIASIRGTALAMRQLPVSQMTPFSFHLPLHRFAASAIRELCLRKDDVNFGMHNLMKRLRTQIPEGSCSSDDLFLGLMEFPLLVLSRVAQVRSDLWKRNGPGLNDQVLNYAEPPFCRNMRDADLLMTQFSVLGRNRFLSNANRPESDVGISFLTNLLLHRLGIFDFVGFFMAPNSDAQRYKQEADAGLYPREEAAPDAFSTDVPLPWTYSPARDTSSRMKLLEEYLHFMIVFISELPPVVPVDRDEQTKQAKQRLFKEVIHRLASGPKTHSELSEVHHVLSHWDNVLLGEEGKLLNPDDATAAALGTVLSDVADRRVSRGGKPEPDKWELRKTAWASYDPAFFHISLRHHQVAAESRPKPILDSSSQYKWESKPFAPRPSDAHQYFARLRRDATADACVLALAYKVLHIHFRRDNRKELADLRGKEVYENKEMSETAVARAVHLLTLGAYAWDGADNGNTNWRNEGGGSAGSIFFDWQAETAPTVTDWINYFLLQDPSVLLGCEWYQGEENALVLLQKLAKSGGDSSAFIAQDASVRSGAAWICAFASSRSKRAASYLDEEPIDGSIFKTETVELDIERRKRLAREKAMARMNAQAAKFASMMDVKLGESEETSDHSSGIDNNLSSASLPATPNRPIRADSFGSTLSSASSMSLTQGDSDTSNIPNFVSLASDVGNIDLATIPQRLLQFRPRCIICNDEDTVEARLERMDHDDNDDGESQRKKSRRRGDNALGFVGYAQASTVMKGGGGPPPGLDSPESAMRGFVGTHVALCGHAVHFECCESYLATVSHREDRAIGKRDEFRCPLCQRLSNCLVPFIDVGVDWIESPTTDPSTNEPESPHSPLIDYSSDSMVVDSTSYSEQVKGNGINDFLEFTHWWVSRHDTNYAWDGHSAFVDKMSQPPTPTGSTESLPRKPARKVRSLKKKDLYAAWNAMMRTPRYVKRRLRPRSAILRNEESSSSDIPIGEESSGETVVWRRFMDQITDIGYKADSKRLGDEQFHTLFGEFRHFLVEKHAYNTLQYPGISRETRDWPSCMFDEPLSDQKRQEMSREKLLSKFFMTVQSFTYSSCCETFDVKRAYQRSKSVREVRQNVGIESIFARYGINRIECGGNLVLLPLPSAVKDSGEQPFEGRLGKLRYLALAIMSAAGAVSADVIQLSFGFPTNSEFVTICQKGLPMRAPVVYPFLLGHIMTHVAAAMFATCGRARAQGDSIDTWQIPLPNNDFIPSSSSTPPHSGTKRIDKVVDDCENFIKLGLVARVQQVLLGRLKFPICGAPNTEPFLNALESSLIALPSNTPDLERDWMKSCIGILQITLRDMKAQDTEQMVRIPTPQHVQNACHFAAAAACSFVSELCTILQLIVPGTAVKYSWYGKDDFIENSTSPFDTLEKLRIRIGLESMCHMIEGKLVQELIGAWYKSARDFSVAKGSPTVSPELSTHLRRTQGFRHLDWPSACSFDLPESKKAGMSARGNTDAESSIVQSHIESPIHTEPADFEESARLNGAEYALRHESGSVLVTFSSKKSVPLLGGFSAEMSKTPSPRVVALPTSYTDLYAELGAIMPECEQTAVCLICGEVLNAGGKGECTRHSYRCGAGAGMFFLLQECSGLIMHKSKAAYIHSPYVDSHGETPQYRGRPLNLDLDRYDHLREIWFGHGVRQQVVAERGSSRQVILPDFY